MKTYIKPFIVMLVITACLSGWSPSDSLIHTGLMILTVGVIFCILIPLPDYLSERANSGKGGRIACDLSKIARDGLVFVGILFLFLDRLHFHMAWAVIVTLILWALYMTLTWLAEQVIPKKHDDNQ